MSQANLVAELSSGVRLAYVDKGSGRPIVLVHGSGADFRAWSPQVDAFSNEFRTITYSRRFSYPNENPGDFRRDRVVDQFEDLEGLIRKLGVAPVHLVGHSQGGVIAAYFAYKHPEMLLSLVLVEPTIASIFISNPSNPIEFLASMFTHPSIVLTGINWVFRTRNPALKAIREGRLEEASRLFINGHQRNGIFDNLPEDFQKMVAYNVKTFDENPWIALRREEINQIRTKTLMIRGETSIKVSIDMTEAVSQCLPNCRIITIPSSGHFPQIQKPKEFNAKVLEFLRTIG